MPRIYPIASGKGGVGKSFVAASLGALMARNGKSVALVDLDLGASNLHTFLGLPPPDRGLNRYLGKRVHELARVAMPTHVANLHLISANDCSLEIANLPHAQKIKLIGAMRQLPFDVVFLDLGAGTHFNTLDFFLATERGILVCTPEPIAVENVYRFIKAIYLRKLKQMAKRDGWHALTRIEAANSDGSPGLDMFDRVQNADPETRTRIHSRFGLFQISLIVNQLRRNIDPALGDKLAAACNRHFFSPFDCLGRVEFDDRIIDSVYSRKLYIDTYPGAQATRQLDEIAGQLGAALP
jgi:flagellar biosynthesis protein FlhG